jgi:hypothetical protein
MREILFITGAVFLSEPTEHRPTGILCPLGATEHNNSLFQNVDHHTAFPLDSVATSKKYKVTPCDASSTHEESELVGF